MRTSAYLTSQPCSSATLCTRSHVLGHVVGEVLAGQEHLGLRALLDIVLPFRRRLHLLHQVDVERGLLGRDLERQPHRARLLEQRDVQPGLDAGRDVAPALGRRDLRSGRQALGVEDAERPLRAALPLADALARIVDVAVDMAAGELHRRLGAALERHVDHLQARRLLDHAGQELVGVLGLRAAHLGRAVLGLHRLEIRRHVLRAVLLHPQQELVLHHGGDRREVGRA